MSIPYGDTPSILFHRSSLKNTNHYHETLMDSQAEATKREGGPCINTTTSHATGNNYDLSYYFHHSSSSRDERAPHYRRGRSLSIGSTISININPLPSPQPPPAPSTPHQQQFTFTSKKTEKNSKIEHPFSGGEQVKLEISPKEIRREGLKALLHSNVPLGYFLYHLLNEYSSENLFFYLAVNNYQSHHFANHSERLKVANKIRKAYLTRNSELEVNLEDRIYRTVIHALDSLQDNMNQSTGNEFEAAKKHVFSLLSVSYHRFRTSNIWEIMESKCNDLKINKQRSQALVTNLLLSHVKRKNHDTVTFKLVHSFCRIYLPVGYDSRLNIHSSNQPAEDKIPEPCSSILPPPPLGTSTTSNRRNRSKSIGNDSKKYHAFISSRLDIFKLSRR